MYGLLWATKEAESTITGSAQDEEPMVLTPVNDDSVNLDAQRPVVNLRRRKEGKVYGFLK